MLEKVKKIINLDETIIDFILCIFIFVITFYLVPQKSTLIKILNPVSVLILILFIEFFCMLYIGDLYKKFAVTTQKKAWFNIPMKIVFLSL
ncbi:hypothetical protein ES705_44511 [subsurface metagenome]